MEYNNMPMVLIAKQGCGRMVTIEEQIKEKYQEVVETISDVNNLIDQYYIFTGMKHKELYQMRMDLFNKLKELDLQLDITKGEI